MQYLANLASYSSDIFEAIPYALEDVAAKYEEVKWEFVFFAKNMQTPHYQETYYMLARKIS